MKHPKLKQYKFNKKIRVKAIRKFNRELNDIIEDCLNDIRPYIKKDIMSLLKKRGILYAETTKKNSTKKKKKK